jgi:hypothetical protein
MTARTTISLPDQLKVDMDAIGESVNWSGVAANAFSMEVDRVKVRRQKLEGKRMKAAIERLKASRALYEAQAHDRGHADGMNWAMDTADYGELKRLSDLWIPDMSTETEEAHGAPGSFQRLISEDQFFNRETINDFWANLGKDRSDSDAYSFQYWDGFVAGALEVFESADI